MTLETYAKQEFEAAGWVDKEGKWKDEAQKWVCENVLAMLKVFSDGNHSGSSASYALSMFTQLASFKPLTPLKGEDSEWDEVSPGMFQNKRCFHVFKNAEGFAHDSQGKVFREPDGSCYVNSLGCVAVKFPYDPKTEYVDVKKDSEKEKTV